LCRLPEMLDRENSDYLKFKGFLYVRWIKQGGRMRKAIRIIPASVLILLLAPAVSPAVFVQSGDSEILIGTWDVELPAMGMQMEFVFESDGEALSGELVFEMGSGVMENITFENGNLEFFVSVDAGGQTVGVDVTAEVEGENMTGLMASDMGEMDFSATKRGD